jgi:hypothetical protein
METEDDLDAVVVKLIREQQAEIERLKGLLPMWIPVSERLPNDDAKVIYSSPHVGVWQGKYIADGCTFSSRGGFLHCSDVSHWMPLPAQPEAGEVTK